MGAYKIEDIQKDFRTATHGCGWPPVELMVITAISILETMPDNAARDMAISHLLQAADMVVNCWISEHKAMITTPGENRISG